MDAPVVATRSRRRLGPVLTIAVALFTDRFQVCAVEAQDAAVIVRGSSREPGKGQAGGREMLKPREPRQDFVPA